MTSLPTKLRRFAQAWFPLLAHPLDSARAFGMVPERVRALQMTRAWNKAPDSNPSAADPPGEDEVNPLLEYFEAHTEGRGIYKWRHYFELYHQHLKKFVGRPVHIAEIGVFSGGSLEMWKQYLGPDCRVTGIDLEPATKNYEDEQVRIALGDQEDRRFWQEFREEHPPLDVLIDDGGHHPAQQVVTVQEMLPHLKPGGVFIIEDIHGDHNRFAVYAGELAAALNGYARDKSHPKAEGLLARSSGWQADIHSVHFYPFAVVIEKRSAALGELVAPRHGTEWQAWS